jgi:NAD+ kinase
MKQKKVFAIFGNMHKEQSIETIQSVLDAVGNYSDKTMIHKPLYEKIGHQLSSILSIELFETHQEIKNQADCLLSIGGDGTFLGTLPFVLDSQIPVIGVNDGRLGFLANTQISDIDLALQHFVNGDYKIDKRSVLEILPQDKNFENQSMFALNDVTIRRSENASMLSFQVDVNDEFLNTYWADGIIVSTPTGSTAYSLSCGGPILMPGSSTFIISPIASHTLTVRPLVLSDESVLKIIVSGRTCHYTLGVDSNSYQLDISVPIIVKKAPFKISIVQFNQHSFLKTIREKLMWGYDKRN